MARPKDDLNLGECLKEGLHRKRISNQDFAKKIGVQPSQLSLWKSTTIPKHHIDSVCNGLGYSVVEFLALAN